MTPGALLLIKNMLRAAATCEVCTVTELGCPEKTSHSFTCTPKFGARGCISAACLAEPSRFTGVALNTPCWLLVVLWLGRLQLEALLSKGFA